MDYGEWLLVEIQNEQHVAKAVAAMADPRSKYEEICLYVLLLLEYSRIN